MFSYFCASESLIINHSQYYRPWDLRADEEDRIDDQIKEAQDQIDVELGVREVPKAEDVHLEATVNRPDEGASEHPAPNARGLPRAHVSPSGANNTWSLGTASDRALRIRKSC